jgi:hypothetical protein
VSPEQLARMDPRALRVVLVSQDPLAPLDRRGLLDHRDLPGLPAPQVLMDPPAPPDHRDLPGLPAPQVLMDPPAPLDHRDLRV